MLVFTSRAGYTLRVNRPSKLLAIFFVSSVSTLVLVINIVASQLVFPNLMFKLLVGGNIDSAREFLENLPEGPLHTSQQRIYNQKYQNFFSEEAKVSGLRRDLALNHYRSLLAISPKNPQLIAKIGLLEQDKTKQDSALQIDPWLKLSLEK